MRHILTAAWAGLAIALVGVARADEPKELAALRPEGAAVFSLALDQGGKRLAVADRGGAAVWDVAAGRELCRLAPAPKRPAPAVVLLSPDGSTAAAGSERGFQLFNATTGGAVGGPLEPHADANDFRAGGFSPDGRHLALVSVCRAVGNLAGGTTPLVDEVSVWDARDGKLKWRYLGERYRNRDGHNVPTGMAFSPDGARLAVPGTIAFTMLPLGGAARAPKPLAYPEKVVRGNPEGVEVRFSPDGKQLAFHLYDRVDIRLADSLQPAPYVEPKGADRAGVVELPPLAAAARNPGNPLKVAELVVSAGGTRAAELSTRTLGKGRSQSYVQVSEFRPALPARQPVGHFASTSTPSDRDEDGPRSLQSWESPGPGGRPGGPRVALSGDGERLAHADAAGLVRVYEVAAVVAWTKSQPRAASKAKK